jgi:hypothetical protein
VPNGILDEMLQREAGTAASPSAGSIAISGRSRSEKRTCSMARLPHERQLVAPLRSSGDGERAAEHLAQLLHHLRRASLIARGRGPRSKIQRAEQK